MSGALRCSWLFVWHWDRRHAWDEFTLHFQPQLDLTGRMVGVEALLTALLYDLGETIEKLKALREMGLRIALDDFGTGYSSLAHLKSLPFDELKIDRSFVSDLARGTDRALVQSIIAIGQHMKIRVIAEGVESSMQRDLLVEMGCECFQGYLFCQPLEEHDFLHWIDERGHGHGSLTHRA